LLASDLERKVADLEWRVKEGADDHNRMLELETQLKRAKDEFDRQHAQLDLEQQLRQRASELEHQLRQKAADLDHQLRQKTAELDVARRGNDFDALREHNTAALESQLRRKTTELEQKTRNYDSEVRELDALLQRKTRELEERDMQYDRASKEMEARLLERENLALDLQRRVEQCERMLTQREEYTADELANLRETVVRLRAELQLGKFFPISQIPSCLPLIFSRQRKWGTARM
jgi:hypothetical protein